MNYNENMNEKEVQKSDQRNEEPTIEKKEPINSLLVRLVLYTRKKKLQIENSIWPTTLSSFFVIFILIFSIMYVDHPKLQVLTHQLWSFGNRIGFSKTYNFIFRILMISLLSSCSFFIWLVYARQYCLKLLFTYKGWIYQSPGSQSKVVLLWGALLRIVSSSNARLYSFQNCLPRMSVPSLNETIKGYLDSVKHVLDSEEYCKIEKEAQNFMNSIGPKLHLSLQLKSWWTPNYHTDWWQKYAYLRDRSPLPINSNPYGLGQDRTPTSNQIARAASITSMMVALRNEIKTEEMYPTLLRKIIPICMIRYKQMFGTSRIPKKGMDELQHDPESNHIVVFWGGFFYKLLLIDSNGEELSASDFEKQFQWIKEDIQQRKAQLNPESKIPAFTAINRDKWADIRAEYFSHGVNSNSINAIETSLFMLTLEDHSYTDLTDLGKHAIHGGGASMWFDKSTSFVILSNGEHLTNWEHSWSDAGPFSYIAEFNRRGEYKLYDDYGNIKQCGKSSTSLIRPSYLNWEISDSLSTLINEAHSLSVKNNADLMLCVKIHDAFGKGFIKKTKTSPDAFIQMAIQLAFYKDQDHRFPWTYEPATTSLFLHGRTETIRSFTKEVKEFILEMCQPNKDFTRCRKLMKEAANKHQELTRAAMVGKGIDRHLFSLYILAKERKQEHSFLNSAMSMPFTLSTSQQPQQQIDKKWDDKVKDLIAPGGGFGPVCRDGYGVSYMVPNNDIIYFHVSSKRSSGKTSSERYVSNIWWALNEMKLLFDDDKKNK